MRVSLDTGSLRAAIGLLARVNPISNCVASSFFLISTSAQGHSISATDGEMQAKISLEIQGNQSVYSHFALPRQALAASVRASESDTFHLEFSENLDGCAVSVSSGAVRAELHSWAEVKTWPRFPGPGNVWVHMLPRDIGQFNRVVFACSKDAGRPQLHGVHIRGNTVFATDSFRAVEADLSANLPNLSLPSSVIRLFSHAEVGAFSIQRAGHLCHIELGKLTVDTTLIADSEINMKRILPTGKPALLLLDRSLLEAKLETISAFCRGSDAAVVQFVAQSGDTISLEVTVPEIGSLTLPFDRISGAFVGQVGFNPRNLLESVRAVTDDTIEFQYFEPSKPVLIQSSGLLQAVLPKVAG
jgi:DNA polymerase III sliding clamp (beta) subunit (PCNA family)